MSTKIKQKEQYFIIWEHFMKCKCQCSLMKFSFHLLVCVNRHKQAKIQRSKDLLLLAASKENTGLFPKAGSSPWTANWRSFKLRVHASSQVELVVKNLLANAGDPGLIPRSGRSPGEGSGNPLQCSCLENPMDRRAWQNTVNRVAKRQTWLKLLSTHAYIYMVGYSPCGRKELDTTEAT